MQRIAWLLLAILFACNIAKPDSSFAIQSHDDEQPITFIVVMEDAAIQDCEVADNDSVSPETDASSGKEASVDCEQTGSFIIGHCLTHQATLCIAYYSDHEEECVNSGQLVSGWFPGDCGENDDNRSALTRSSGGCQDKCGLIRWSYRLGGYPPNEETRQSVKNSCEANGNVYVPTPNQQ